MAHQKRHNEPSRMFVEASNYTDIEKLNNEESEGAYTLRPEWFD